MTKAQTKQTNEQETRQTPQTTAVSIPIQRPLSPFRSEAFDLFPFMTSPFTFMRRFSEDMENLFSDLGFGRETSLFGEDWAQAQWTPKVEVFERDNKFIVSADLPGLKKEDIKVDVLPDRLTIRGERKEEHEEKAEGLYRSERSYGSFCRVIPLPEGADIEKAKADFKNGVLEVSLPAPSQKSVGRRLEIGN